MKEIVMIPIGELYHHPENPRKDLGDISELTESIRKNGIFQNLTVIRGHQMTKAEFVAEARAEGADKASAEGMYRPEDAWTDEGYTVVIGNRRMEASKAAGLADVPCVISEMDHREQISTMLEENMQRQDLTVYEQAQGFQMMMDLGYTPKEIGEKTGFSEKTVKDRIKLTKFNQKKFSEAVNRGATLLDLIEISKIESKREQNEVMDAVGTNNFRRILMDKLQEQEFKKGSDYLEPILKDLGLLPLPDGADTWRDYRSLDYYGGDKVMANQNDKTIRRYIKKKSKEAEEKQLFYRFSHRWDSSTAVAEIYTEKEKTAKEFSEEEKTERQRSLARNKHVKKVKEFWGKAFVLRRDFIRNYTVSVNGTGITAIGKIIPKYALSQKTSWGSVYNHQWDKNIILDLLGITEEEYEDKSLSVWQMIEGRSDIPMIRAVVAWIVGGGIFWPDAPEHGLYDSYDGEYAPNSYQANGIKELYQFLVEIGYQMSDMEKQLMDGTHECYKKEAAKDGET